MAFHTNGFAEVRSVDSKKGFAARNKGRQEELTQPPVTQ